MEKELPKAARSILPLCPRHPLDIGAVEGRSGKKDLRGTRV